MLSKAVSSATLLYRVFPEAGDSLDREETPERDAAAERTSRFDATSRALKSGVGERLPAKCSTLETQKRGGSRALPKEAHTFPKRSQERNHEIREHRRTRSTRKETEARQEYDTARAEPEGTGERQQRKKREEHTINRAVLWPQLSSPPWFSSGLLSTT